MVLIRKSRILFVIMAVIVSVCVFERFNTDVHVEKVSEEIHENVALVNAVPVSNKVIVVDAGHGDPDGGAIGTLETTEAEINLQIALKLQELLEESGATVILTRSDENGIYDNEDESISQKKVSDIKNRVEIGNDSSADIFVSIHLNKIDQNQYYGWQTFYNKNSDEGKKLAESIQSGLNETIQTENTRISKSIENIYIIEHVEIPITIVECGFLSNKEEEIKLNDEEYQENLAYGIYIGIMDYFESNSE